MCPDVWLALQTRYHLIPRCWAVETSTPDEATFTVRVSNALKVAAGRLAWEDWFWAAIKYVRITAFVGNL